MDRAGLVARALALLLLAAVALAPAVSRAHLRVTTHPTPAQENAHFKWSNSCECGPLRLADDHRLSPIPPVPFAVVEDSSPRREWSPEPELIPVLFVFATSPALRAPPSLIS